MKKMTLNAFISEQQENDPEFTAHYQRELLVNELARAIAILSKEVPLGK